MRRREQPQAVTEKGKPIGYRNASDILPAELIEQIREYVEGEAIYIPKADKHSKWGENSGLRKEYSDRNRHIAEERRDGTPVSALALKYCLSEDSIRKILKKQKR